MGLPPARAAGQIMANCERHDDNRKSARDLYDDADVLNGLGVSVARDCRRTARPTKAVA